MTTYRAHVLSTEAAGDGTVHFDCWIQRETSPDVWEDIPRGHRTLVLQSSAILSITESGMTDPQKRTALCDLFRAEAKGWGIDESDDADQQLLVLIPEWPVDVVL